MIAALGEVYALLVIYLKLYLIYTEFEVVVLRSC